MKKPLIKKLWFVTIILILGLLSSILLGMTGRINREKRQNFIYTDMLHELQLEITKAHLLLEKIIRGDKTVKPDRIWRNIDVSVSLADAMLIGGKSLHNQDVQPMKEGGLYNQTRQLKSELMRYRTLARTNYNIHLAGDSAAERQLDKFYEQIVAQAALLDHKIEIIQADHEVQTRILFWSILLPWAIALFVAVNGFRKWELDRRQAAVLAKAHDELETQVKYKTAELLAANERLHKQYKQQNIINALLEISLETLFLEEYLARTLDLLLVLPWLRPQAKGAIFLVEETQGVLVMKVNSGFSTAAKEICSLLKFGTCTCGQAAADGKLIHRPAGDRSGKLLHLDPNPPGCYCVPILTGDQVLGLIILYLPEGHSRAKEEEEFLGAIAATLAGIIERKRIEEEAAFRQAQVIQADKMASLGLMLSGVTHEINNPNNYILSNAQVIKDICNDSLAIMTEYSQGQDQTWQLGGLPYREAHYVMPKLLDGIIDGSRRIQKIVEDLKNFVRQGPSRMDESLDLNQIITAAVEIVKTQVKKHTDNFHLKLAEKLPPVKGSGQKLEQVMINLILNAAQALPDRNSNIWVSSSFNKLSGQVVVQVKDEGQGIMADDLKKITSPFFTTKVEKGGTGLGLAISYSILKEHKGKLEFESIPGQGTIARILLPIT